MIFIPNQLNWHKQQQASKKAQMCTKEQSCGSSTYNWSTFFGFDIFHHVLLVWGHWTQIDPSSLQHSILCEIQQTKIKMSQWKIYLRFIITNKVIMNNSYLARNLHICEYDFYLYRQIQLKKLERSGIYPE